MAGRVGAVELSETEMSAHEHAAVDRAKPRAGIVLDSGAGLGQATDVDSSEVVGGSDV